MDKYAKQALQEYNSEGNILNLGCINGRAFWNTYSTQFMFVPSFNFPVILKAKNYLFTAEDKNGAKHVFTATTPTASLKPIWSDIPEGIVHLKVESLNEDGKVEHIVGGRTFYKMTPFPGRDFYPNKACSYRECALSAYRYLYNDKSVQYWLKYGLPMPDYPHNVYPSKTIDCVIRAMVAYAKLEPACSKNALNIACRAADYLISISFGKGHPLEGLPPTYSFKNLNADAVIKVAPAAQRCVDQIMMIYPISAGVGYLTLWETTGNEKYFNAAMCIAEYYKKSVLPSGTWYLLCDCETGKPLSENLCVDFNFVYFFHKLYEITQDDNWHKLEMSHYKYITDKCLRDYQWEGQFEDIEGSLPYRNLTHFQSGHLINYITNYLSNDEKMVEEAIGLMRYIEDQFVVWGKHPEWNYTWGDKPWHYPAGLEQYSCYVPIDSSTSAIMMAFLNMYKLTGDRLYLEKAMALADTITQIQNHETGQIPTFLMGENCSYGYENFWLNCLFFTANSMMNIAELTEQMNIE